MLDEIICIYVVQMFGIWFVFDSSGLVTQLEDVLKGFGKIEIV